MRKNLCLCGFGNVGREFVRSLAARQSGILADGLDLRLVAILGQGGGIYQKSGLNLAEICNLPAGSSALRSLTGLWSEEMTGVRGIAAAQAHLLIEATPTDILTGEPGLSHFRAAIANGMDIVTFAKGPLVKEYRSLQQAADARRVTIKASGATAAALPAMDVGCYSLAGDTILQFAGILNGTTNYILTRMAADGLAYEAALADAVTAGIAETNPRLDIEGWDTASKTIILANALMKADLDLADIQVKGIQHVTAGDIRAAQGRGEVIKLIGQAIRTERGVEVTVGPVCLPLSHPLSAIQGTAKAIRYVGQAMGEVMVSGGRSDLAGTAAAGLKDVLNLYRRRK
jgi:homoserine dehydrogenase